MANTDKIMAHMIPYYPDYQSSLDAVKGLRDGGAGYIEIQFPFSDPSADGPVIESACYGALDNGFKVNKGFEFVKEVAGTTDTPVYIMTYCTLVFKRGIETFVADAKAAGARGLIIPDMPPESDEGLADACKAAGLQLVPVIVPVTSDKRIELIMSHKPELVYIALRKGITGSETTLGDDNLSFLNKIKAFGVETVAGFGIHKRDAVRTVCEHVDGAVIGSEIIRLITRTHDAKGDVYTACKEYIQKMSGALS